MERNARIYVAGHTGLVGSGLVRRLSREGYAAPIVRTRQECNLTSRPDVFRLFAETRPEYVFMAAAKVGGIGANVAAPVEFLVENLEIQNNLFQACLEHGVKKVLFLGSSCIYPREASQPMSESCFMHGPLEPTNESYAVAKIAGIQLARAMYGQYALRVVCPMPCNIYGPGDHFELERSHVLSALVRRFCEARASGAPSVTLWGSGTPRREFLHVDDLADACFFLMEHFESPEIINVGSGIDVSIQELAGRIAEAVGYVGSISWDTSKPDGMPRKLLDVSKLERLGWCHQISLDEGIRSVIADFQARYDQSAAPISSAPARAAT